MSTCRKAKNKNTKSTQHKPREYKEVDLMLQKLGDKWYAFLELNGNVYYQGLLR
ncbi:MAG: hypothetical protein BroJett040_14630 [Oligoflexia bacterium]|nr:MAG: hypothetical protein BroJett040_14630 [Oligoflexia bacterium]